MLNNLIIEGVVVRPPKREKTDEVVFTIENNSSSERFDVLDVLVVTKELLAERVLEKLNNGNLVRIVGALNGSFSINASYIELGMPNGKFIPILSP